MNRPGAAFAALRPAPTRVRDRERPCTRPTAPLSRAAYFSVLNVYGRENIAESSFELIRAIDLPVLVECELARAPITGADVQLARLPKDQLTDCAGGLDVDPCRLLISFGCAALNRERETSLAESVSVPLEPGVQILNHSYLRHANHEMQVACGISGYWPV